MKDDPFAEIDFDYKCAPCHFGWNWRRHNSKSYQKIFDKFEDKMRADDFLTKLNSFVEGANSDD